MSTQRYSVTPHPIETLLTWVKSGEIAIPEIQRPFVWEPTKVRNLLDSLYQGYPVGYLIAWRNPTVKLKDGTPSGGKRILIDGQQRVTALMAALLGREVLTKDYETVRIRIASQVAKSAVLAGPAASYGDLIRPIAPTPAADVARIYLSYLTETADLSNLREASAYVTWPGSRLLVSALRGGDQRPLFVGSFVDRYGQPSALAGSAYDALTLIETAAAMSPAEIDPARLRQRLEANTVAGVTTRYTFTPTRHVGFASDDLALLVWDRQRSAAILPPARVTDR